MKFDWLHGCQQKFDQLKQWLVAHPILRHPNWNMSFHVYFDASSVFVGNALYQFVEDTQRDYLIAFASKQLAHIKKNYTTTEHECLSMVYFVRKNPSLFVNEPNGSLC
jgi:hypothetical protein